MFAGIRIPLDQPLSSISKFVPIYPREDRPPMPVMAPIYDVGLRQFITKPPPLNQPLSSLAKVPITRQIACPQCRSTLQIVPPSSGALVTEAFTWLRCPACGFARLAQAPTGGYRVEVVSLMRPPITPPPLGMGTWKETICKKCDSTLRFYDNPSLGPKYNISANCPVCGADLGVESVRGEVQILQKRVRLPTEEIRPPTLPPPTKVMPDWFIQQIYDALEQYEEKIIELEEALRTAQAAEFYNNPYGTIEAHAQTLLNQFTRYQPTAGWPLSLSTRWSELSSRLQKLIIDCRTAAKQRKPISTYEEATDEQQTQWITDTTRQLQQQGLAWSDVRFLYPQPGQTSINGRARLPVAEGVSPLSELFTEVPIGFPDYSVEQKMQTVAEQEAWQLGEVVAPVVPKKISPYLILAGLGVATAGVWYYKKKKRGG